MIDVLSLGAGVQSSTLFLMACKDLLPRPRAAIFADTQYEPAAVYAHLEWLKEMAAKAGIDLVTVSAGNLREDAIAFRQKRESADGKRHASIPAFVKNADGSRGMIRRQCTGSYKIDPIERYIRRKLLNLRHKQPAPKEVVIRQWIGISSDEGQRARYPGRWIKGKDIVRQQEMFGDKAKSFSVPVWKGDLWRCNAYPFLDLSLWPDRKNSSLCWLPFTFSRDDCKAWLRKAYPEREIPRSACIGCPLRSNDEWRAMRDNDPDSWKDAVEFDHQQRRADAAGQEKRGILVGAPFIHSSLVPLDMVDLSLIGDLPSGSGCGVLFDRDNEGREVDGMCGL